jgi:hypothetical protein
MGRQVEFNFAEVVWRRRGSTMTGTIGVGPGLIRLGGFLKASFALRMKRMPAWRRERT